MKYAVITGASAGIGKEISIDLASRGYGVVLVARRIEKLIEVAKTIRKENKGKESLSQKRNN